MAADPITTSTIDDIFNEAFSETDDPFADKPTTALNSTRDDKAILSPRKRKNDNDDPFADLGLNDEVKIKKVRIPNPKLDESLLLSALGIPKLRAVAKKDVAKKLRFKGKGHEFTDVGKLLNYYQLWLDDLFPRAKFADGLKMVEKVGHSKRMAVVRKEWIDEGKPGYVSREMMQKELEEAAREREREMAVERREVERRKEDMFFPSPSKGAQKKTGHGGEEPDEDDLDALLAEQSNAATRKERRTVESDEEDDLDALLAEQDAIRKPPSPPPTSSRTGDEDEDEDDDLDALLAEHEAHGAAPPAKVGSRKRQAVFDEDSDDEDALDALLSEQKDREELPLPAGPSEKNDGIETASEVQETDGILSSSPLPNNPEEEDLDALLASQEARDDATKQGKADSQGQKDESQGQEDDFFGSPIPNDEEL